MDVQFDFTDTTSMTPLEESKLRTKILKKFDNIRLYGFSVTYHVKQDFYSFVCYPFYGDYATQIEFEFSGGKELYLPYASYQVIKTAFETSDITPFYDTALYCVLEYLAKNSRFNLESAVDYMAMIARLIEVSSAKQIA